jgi:hypothetical protein
MDKLGPASLYPFPSPTLLKYFHSMARFPDGIDYRRKQYFLPLLLSYYPLYMRGVA